jgi:hypothetical protein
MEVRRAIVGFLGDACTGAHLPAGVDTFHTAPIFPWEGRWAAGLLREIETEITDLRAELETRYNGLSDLAPYQRHLLLDLTIRQATWISTSFDLCGAFAEISCPFFDRAWIRFMFNMRLADLRGQAFYREWLSRQKPIPPKAGALHAWAERLAAGAIWMTARAARGTSFFTYHPIADWPRVISTSSAWLNGTTDCRDWLGRLSRTGLAQYLDGKSQAAFGFLLAVPVHLMLRGAATRGIDDR